MKHLFGWMRCAVLACVAAAACGCVRHVEVKHMNNYQTEIRLRADSRYLLLPVEDGAPDATVIVRAEGLPEKRFRVALARSRTDYLVPFDLEAYRGREVSVRIDGCSYDALCWEEFALSDRFRPARESRYRPLYHHAPRYGWMNDPNGMVWHKGEYHLFFQRNPYGSRWENMTWGHSVSRDLVRWEHLPDVLEPDSLGMIFSGCCVADSEDTAGFGSDALVALYTAAGRRQSQCLAFSRDGGLTFEKYAGNPVLTSAAPDFRDPKVFWHASSMRWIMVLAVGQQMEFYSSSDLREWRFESRFGDGYGCHDGVWECPDLFELAVDGDPQRSKWVLLCSLGTASGSKVQYFTGDFDGHAFMPDSPGSQVKWLDYGRDCYAAVTWSDTPDGRRILLGWMNNWQYANEVPTRVFRGANTLPRELFLSECDGGVRLKSAPVREAEALWGEPVRVEPFVVEGEYNLPPLTVHGDGAYRIVIEMACGSAEVCGFRLFNRSGESVDCCLSRLDGTLSLDRTKSGQTAFSPAFPSVSVAPLDGGGDGIYRLDVWVDRSSLELFVDGGCAALTEQIFPSEPYGRMNFYAKGGECRVRRLEFYRLEEGQNNLNQE